MGLGRFIHHFGTFLLFVATILLVVASISAPVVNDIALLEVDLDDSLSGSRVTFGTFGYCILDVNGKDDCSKSQVGYNPASVMYGIESTDFSNTSRDTSKALTNVMVLHPVAAGLCFIAFILCLATGTVGSLLASLLSGFSFIVILVALICDFVGLGIVKHKVDDDDSNSKAHWAVAIWLVLASAVCTLLATIVVFLTCCAGRARRNREARKMEHYNETSPVAPRRRHFWQRGRY